MQTDPSRLGAQLVACQGPDWRPRAALDLPGTCGACGKPLTGRHLWFCPSRPGTAFEVGRSCRANYAAHHFWSDARAEALRRAGGKCVRCGAAATEVNHIAPRNGAGYGNGCHNHQDNLEALCHADHLAETARQQGYHRTREAQEMRRLVKRQARFVSPWPGMAALVTRGVPVED